MNEQVLKTYIAEVKARIYQHEEKFTALVLADFQDDLNRHEVSEGIKVCRRWLASYRRYIEPAPKTLMKEKQLA